MSSKDNGVDDPNLSSVVSSADAVDITPSRSLVATTGTSESIVAVPRRQQHQQQQGRRRKRVLDPILSLPVTSPVSSLCFVSPNTYQNGLTSAHNDDDSDDDSDEIDDRADDNGDSDSDSDSDDEEVVFRSSTMLGGEAVSPDSTTLPSNSSSFGTSSTTTTTTRNLNGRFLVTCHHDGGLLLWDLNLQQPTSLSVMTHLKSSSTATTTTTTTCNNNRGPGLAVRRTDNSSRFVYQTRDAKSTVSLHAVDTTTTIVRSYETFSEGFCQVAPCCGNEHLLAMPCGSASTRGRNDDRSVVIVDHRAKDPAVKISISSSQSNVGRNNNSHGMVTSLGLSVGGVESEQQHTQKQQRSDRTILACGMESGTSLFYDLAMPSHPMEEYDGSSDFAFDLSPRQQHIESPFSVCSLGNEPILSMDLTPSRPKTQTTSTEHDTSPNGESSLQSSAVLAIAGLAGDAAELERLSKEQAGRIVLFKATVPNVAGIDLSTTSRSASSHFHFQQRARLSTLSIDGDNSNNEKSIVPVKYENIGTKKRMGVSAGKPGVSICRFRPQDGRLFAVGGWDRRVRLFDRTHGKAMAILRGHDDSVSAFDWSHDADTSGFLASSGRGTKIVNIWQCFGS